jgi:hypothetical protein
MIKRKTTDDPRPDTKGPYISILARRCVYLARLYKRQVPRLASAPFYFIHHPPTPQQQQKVESAILFLFIGPMTFHLLLLYR